jgi:glycosyltransferase involved in cell wall biosynthesis
MTRIAIISEHASPLALTGGTDAGGQNIYVAHLAKQLAKRGYRIDVFTRRDDPAQPSVMRWQPGVRVVHLDAGPAEYLPKEELLEHMPEFSDNLLGFCRRQSVPYALAHANFFMSGLAARTLQQVLGLPFVITFHALGRVRRAFQREADRFPEERMSIEDDLVCYADSIIAECPQDRADLLNLYGADASRISVIPCGFDPKELWPSGAALRTQLGIRDDEFVVLQLGRLVARKGIDNVIRAIAVLKRVYGIVARLLVVGGATDKPSAVATPEIGRLRRIAREQGVTSQVMFLGRRGRDVLRTVYSAADVFVTTPWYEPFGITPIEAMACGLPVVGADVGGIKYSVQNNRTGFLVPPENPDALAQRLAQLQRDPQLAQRMGRQGRERAQLHFTWEAVAAQVAALYERVIPMPILVRPPVASIASVNIA